MVSSVHTNYRYDMAFGDRLVDTRRRVGISQEELARRAQIQRSHLSKIENGRITQPSDAVVRRLADALDVDTSELTLTPHANESSPEYDAITAVMLQKTAHWTPGMKALLWRFIDGVNDELAKQEQ